MNDEATPARRRRLHAILAGLTVAIGAALMAMMIVTESEPGGIPILIVLLGLGWFFVSRARIR